jgi:hypothetical protein
MRWLVTIKRLADREKMLEQLRSLRCEVLTSDRPVTLGNDEEILSVEGPANLVQLAEPYASTMKIYPNSTMKLY